MIEATLSRPTDSTGEALAETAPIPQELTERHCRTCDKSLPPDQGWDFCDHTCWKERLLAGQPSAPEQQPGWVRVLAETTSQPLDMAGAQLASWLTPWAKSKRVTAATLRDRGCFLIPTYRNVYNEDKTKVIARSYSRRSHMLMFPAVGADGAPVGWQAVKPPRKNQPKSETLYRLPAWTSRP